MSNVGVDVGGCAFSSSHAACVKQNNRHHQPTTHRSDDDESTYADALSPRSSASASPVNLDALLAAGGSGGGGIVHGGGGRRGPGASSPPGPGPDQLPQLNDAGFQTASVRDVATSVPDVVLLA